jgi:lactate permease
MIDTVVFLKTWKPEPDPAFAVVRSQAAAKGDARVGYGGWMPWVVVSVIVIAWINLKVFEIGDTKILWPGLNNAVFITLYQKPYAALWDFQPLGTGTAILLSAIIVAALTRTGIGDFLGCVGRTWVQTRIAIATVMMIVGLAFLLNYSGMSYTLGMGVASTGAFFPLVSAFLGWIAVFLSGSDTSGNALFGNLQVVAAHQLKLDPVLMAATNSSGGVMGKMISPQNIATGVSTTDLRGKEGVVFARTFWHSVLLTLLLGILVVAQQHWFTWMIATLPGK